MKNKIRNTRYEIRNTKYKIRDIKGFTLVEMITVLFVVSVLLGISADIYFRQKDRLVYNDAISKTTDMIRTARNAAISAMPIPVKGENKVPKNGYGVYINLKPEDDGKSPHFTVFASMSSSDGTEKKYDKSKDYIMETFRLPRTVKLQYFIFGSEIKAQTNTDGTIAPDEDAKEAVIFFRPPLAETYLGDNKGNDLEELGMRFYNGGAAQNSPKKCQYVRINRIKTFPTIDYSNCQKL